LSIRVRRDATVRLSMICFRLCPVAPHTFERRPRRKLCVTSLEVVEPTNASNRDDQEKFLFVAKRKYFFRVLGGAYVVFQTIGRHISTDW
jgi:hypothetical protein